MDPKKGDNKTNTAKGTLTTKQQDLKLTFIIGGDTGQRNPSQQTKSAVTSGKHMFAPCGISKSEGYSS